MEWILVLLLQLQAFALRTGLAWLLCDRWLWIRWSGVAVGTVLAVCGWPAVVLVPMTAAWVAVTSRKDDDA